VWHRPEAPNRKVTMDGGAGESGPDQDLGHFGTPLFEDPSARALRRVGVIDVGSNSVRMVVFDGAARSPAYFYNEKILCGLGRDLARSGRLHPEGRRRALAALRRFTMLAQGMQVSPLCGVATAAVREAADGAAFLAEVEEGLGLRLEVISGEEEARLSAQGVLLGWPGAEGLVCDMGGSSMELAEVTSGRVGRCLSSRIGPLRLETLPGGRKEMKRLVAAEMTALRGQMNGNYDRLFLVGGSWRTIARLDMERRGYPLTVLHEYELTPQSARASLKWIETADLEAVRARTGTSAERMRLIPVAALVLRELIRKFAPRHIAISSYGIREGLLYEQMPEHLRHRDPLIEAARFAEASSARVPGFGKVLYNFLLPLYRTAPHARLRLVKAACLLHDTAWRAHPDYRHEVCFDNATRANLGGLTHGERIFLGLALLHRYKNARAPAFDALAALIVPRDVLAAEILGKAMRFGAMLTGHTPERMGALRHVPQRRALELVMDEASAGLFGEVVMARFEALARAMGCAPRVVLRPAAGG